MTSYRETHMKFRMATVTKYHKIRKFIVKSIKINMMDLQPSFSNNTSFAFMFKIFISHFSVANSTFHRTMASYRTKISFSNFPIFNLKRSFTCFTNFINKYFGLKFKIACPRTVSIFSILTCQFKRFKALLSCSKSIRELMFYRAFNTTESSFRSIRNELFITCFTNFFHNPILHRCVFWYKNSLKKYGGIYGV